MIGQIDKAAENDGPTKRCTQRISLAFLPFEMRFYEEEMCKGRLVSAPTAKREVGFEETMTEAYEFASRVDTEIHALSEKEFNLRTGRAKKLREELYPLSRLALHFKRPGLAVKVQAFDDCGPRDGHISISGFWEREFEVEITNASYGYEDSLRAELLVIEGLCPGAGMICRDKVTGKIVAEMAGCDIDEPISRIASAAVERFRDKAMKQYSPETILLIAFEEAGFCGCIMWHRMLRKIEELGGMRESTFSAVYLFNGRTNEIHRAA